MGALDFQRGRSSGKLCRLYVKRCGFDIKSTQKKVIISKLPYQMFSYALTKHFIWGGQWGRPLTVRPLPPTTATENCCALRIPVFKKRIIVLVRRPHICEVECQLAKWFAAAASRQVEARWRAPASSRITYEHSTGKHRRRGFFLGGRRRQRRPSTAFHACSPSVRPSVPTYSTVALVPPMSTMYVWRGITSDIHCRHRRHELSLIHI